MRSSKKSRRIKMLVFGGVRNFLYSSFVIDGVDSNPQHIMFTSIDHTVASDQRSTLAS